MEWGLNGVQLSHLHDAIHVEATTQSGWGSVIGEDVETMCNDALQDNNINPKYDFYLTRDTKSKSLEIRNFSGYNFNKEMAIYILTVYSNHQEGIDSKDKVARINSVDLASRPKSAFSYCYNKNKRNENGEVVFQDANGNWNTDNLKWYLPAIDEIEDVSEFAYQFRDGVFQGNMYWSCQPAFTMIDHCCPVKVPDDYYKV